MSEPNTNPATDQNATNATQPATIPAPLPEKMDDIDTVHFSGDKLADGFALLQHFASKAFPVVHNLSFGDDGSVKFDAANNELYIFTVGKTMKVDGNDKRVPFFAVAAEIPGLNAVLSSDKGQDYISDSVRDSFEKKLRSAIGNVKNAEISDFLDKDGKVIISLPQNLAAFMASGRGEGNTDSAIYKEYAVKMQAALKKKGLQIAQGALRDCLMSSKVAEANYPNVPQDVWVLLLTKAREMAERDKKPAAVFQHWIDTRDKASSDVSLKAEDLDF